VGGWGLSSPKVIVPVTESVIGFRIKTTFSAGESGSVEVGGQGEQAPLSG
jgi:hypothetical protein